MGRRLRVVALIAAAVVALGGCDWSMFRYDAGHAGGSADTGISKADVQAGLALDWSAAAGGAVSSSPAVANGVAFVGSPDHNLYAFDAAGKTSCAGTPVTCTALWTGTTGGAVSSSPAVANGVVYVASGNGKLYAFDAGGVTNCAGTPKKCNPLWTANANALSSPTVVNGIVYVGSGTNLAAYDAAGATNCAGAPKTCNPLWTAATGGTVVSSPAVTNGVAYIGAGTHLYAFDAAGTTNCGGAPKSCTPLWTAATGGTVNSSPAVTDSVVYIGAGSNLAAFDATGTTHCGGTPKTCTALWTATTGGTVSSSPAVANGFVFVGSADSHFYAFDAAGATNCAGTPKTCTAVWSATTGGAVTSSPAAANGVVYVGSADHNTYAFDATGVTKCAGTPKTCTALWSATSGGAVTSSPAVANGVVYIGSGDGNLYAYGVPPANPLSITNSSMPRSVTTGQAIAFTITVVNKGAAAATGLSLTDTLTGLDLGQMDEPVIRTNLGGCTFTAPTETCTLASLAAGQTWTVNMTVEVAAVAGTTLSNTANATGTESGFSYNVAATTSTVVAPNVAAGFAQTQLAGGLANPIALAFAPNGDIYVAEQFGNIVIYRNGAVLPTPVLSLSVFAHGETGLLGIALDPNFATNGYMYVSYTNPVTNGATTDGYSRLSRFTVVNDVANPASEFVYYQGDQAQLPNGTSPSYDHAGNDVKVGPDGKLWWSVGDNVPDQTNAQALNNIYGKVLRFNLDGSVPADNPFTQVSGAVPYIYAYGLRNPWRFTFLPTGEVMTEDTGSDYWEDVDTLASGDNWGWPLKEGNCGSCGYRNPAYAYGHLPTDGAASAITSYTGTTFPAQYNHTVFVGDYVRGDIEAIAFDPTYKTQLSDTVFDTTAGTIADLREGPDGNLYYVSIFEGTLSKLAPVGPFPPTATASATPNAGNAPLPTQFSSSGSSDPYGKPLTYSWNFGDGSATSTAANPAHTYTQNGTYNATLTVSNGQQTAQAQTQVFVGHTAPTASIAAPATYNAGDTVPFSGTANDAVDGTMPAYDYSWSVDFYSNGVAQPSYFAEVPGPFYGPTPGITNGSFQIPNDTSQTPSSFYRITLTVTDSLGIRTVVTKDLHPNTTTWSASTNVAGLGYWVDGVRHTGTYNATDVVGVKHVLTGMSLAQTVGANRYRFGSWSDGSALSDVFTAGVAPVNYNAVYDAVQNTMPASWTSADVGAPITPGAADASPTSGSFYLDGAGTDVWSPNDQFHYVYQSLAGDGTIVARVRYQTYADPWAKAGVMIKQSATTGAPFVDALVTPDFTALTPNANGVGCTPDGCLSPLPPVDPAMGNGASMQYSGPGSSNPAAYPAGFTSPNRWLKLQRAGNTFTAWLSADGTTWTQIGTTTLAMTGPVTIGLFDSSHNDGVLNTTAFDHVQVTVP
jgi:glucose/arabinose dehydrogenase/outer membrane protein assembly factor BamB